MTQITRKKIGAYIKKLREEMGLSQSDVADKLGIPRQSVGQIETGERDINGIELMGLARIFSVSADTLLAGEAQVRPKPGTWRKVDAHFDTEALRNVLLYVLSRCGGKPNIGETVLYKLLYFIDFDAFEIYGKPITGMAYVKLQYGPVPMFSQYQSVIKEMTEKGELKIIKQVYGGMPQKKYVALTDADISGFRPEQLRLMDEVIDRLSSMNASKITEYVHEDVPWRDSETNKIIDYRLVLERSAPYARLDRETMWQDAAGSDSLKVLGRMPKEEREYYENI